MHKWVGMQSLTSHSICVSGPVEVSSRGSLWFRNPTINPHSLLHPMYRHRSVLQPTVYLIQKSNWLVQLAGQESSPEDVPLPAELRRKKREKGQKAEHEGDQEEAGGSGGGGGDQGETWNMWRVHTLDLDLTAPACCPSPPSHRVSAAHAYPLCGPSMTAERPLEVYACVNAAH